jgi:rhodanese-related sulfurtransferase
LRSVLNLRGGFDAWSGANLAVERETAMLKQGQ